MEASANPMALETKPRPWWLLLIDGIAVLVIGAVLLAAPAKTKVDTWMLLVTLLGLWWILRGIMDIVGMFIDHTAWGWKLFTGIISVIAGSYILMYPIASALALPRIFVLVLGFWGLMNGVVLLIMAFRGAGWGAGILGVLEIVFGALLVANYAALGMGLTFLWTAAWFAVIGGIVLIVQAFRMQSAARA